MSKLEYSLSIVGFFDILGFKNIVEQKDPDEILEIVDIFKKRTQPDDELASMFDLRFSSFSDLVVRTVDLLPTEGYDMPHEILFNEIIDLVHVQCDLISRGILIRGGISIKEIYHREDVIFGPALIEAYKLESCKALYPRVIIKKQIVDEVIDQSTKDLDDDLSEDEIGYILNMLRESDDYYFIDYLRFIYNQSDSPQQYLNFLIHHKKLVTDGYSQFKNHSKIKKKYIWLAEYHNNVVKCYSKMLSAIGVDEMDYLIPEEVIPNQNLLVTGNDFWRN